MRNLTATLCLTLAVLLGNAGMSWSADFQEGMKPYITEHGATVLREWKPLAEQGNVAAQLALAGVYYIGSDLPQNYKKAVKWYRKAAEQGNASAQNSLGLMYYDEEMAMEAFKRVAETR